ncbi:multiprotein-bridging factor 1 family protein [Streptomyces phyllanthi]|uniref:Helix-turn-helix domain-containing protein n=1 Tax=Streptomyces phyllanthi TaxID=1803180 RepID=A0A5N8WF85_9ACTN|nr:helix-turn-helix domain-containing protein [Streptomyces phyllanthi]
MGRRENPIGQCGRTLRSLAAWLRAGREAAGLTYEQLAARTEFSADTLARAASGRSVPRNLDVVLAYARACDLSVKEAEKYWKLARRDEARAVGVLSGHRGGVHISVVKDFADLHSAIVDLYQNGGSPPLRSLDARIGGLGRLPHSTAGRVLKGRSTPSRLFVLAFAEVFGVRKSDLPEWGKAWDRADRDRRSARSRLRDHGQSGLLDRLTTHDRVTPRDLQLLMSDLESSARREPGLKLLVHIPDTSDTEAHKAARMTRELLVDQAQRRGVLSCPQCQRPSFGYDDSTGWRAALCSDCSHAPVAPSAARLPDRPEASPQDTPTLSLRVPEAAERPTLPRRVPGGSWPFPSGLSPSRAQDADNLETISDQAPPAATTADGRCRLCHEYHEADDIPPPAPGTGTTTPGTGTTTPGAWPRITNAGPVTALGAHTTERRPPPSHQALSEFFAPRRSHQADAKPDPRPTTPTLTTRIRINIPGSRPIPPIVIRRAAPEEPPPSRHAPHAPPSE